MFIIGVYWRLKLRYTLQLANNSSATCNLRSLILPTMLSSVSIWRSSLSSFNSACNLELTSTSPLSAEKSLDKSATNEACCSFLDDAIWVARSRKSFLQNGTGDTRLGLFWGAWTTPDSAYISVSKNDKDMNKFFCLLWHGTSGSLAPLGQEKISHCLPSKFVSFQQTRRKQPQTQTANSHSGCVAAGGVFK